MATPKGANLSSEDVEMLKKLEQTLRDYPSALSYGNYEKCIELLSEAIQTTASFSANRVNDTSSNNSPFLHRQAVFHYKRAKIYFKAGELKLSYDDCAAIRKLDAANPKTLSIYSEYLLPALQLEALILILLGNDRHAKQILDEIVSRVEGEGEEGQDNLLEEIVRTVLPKSSSLLMTPNLSAMQWHAQRRQLILALFPEVAQLFENSKSPVGRSFWSKHVGLCLATLLLGISAAHFILALLVAWYGTTLTMLACSCSVGAFFAYGIQALNHDLCHVRRHRGLNSVCMVLASSLCNFPWAMYYREYHQRHHANTGTEYDRDGDILFQPWQSPLKVKVKLRFPRFWRSSVKLIRWFQYFEEEAGQRSKERVYEFDYAESPVWRLAWTVMFSWGIYLVFHIRKYQFDTFHVPQLKYEGLWLLTTLVVLHFGGVYSILYLWWSSAFSLGAFAHPYLGFWLIQHAAKHRAVDESTLTAFAKLSLDPVWTIRKLKAEAFQPTFSSLGLVENILNFGELQHVEHHDFPMIPAVRYHYLNTKAAPEFYQNLGTCPSVMGAIHKWIVSNDSKWMIENGDFAGRERYLTDGFEEQREAALFYSDQR